MLSRAKLEGMSSSELLEQAMMFGLEFESIPTKEELVEQLSELKAAAAQDVEPLPALPGADKTNPLFAATRAVMASNRFKPNRTYLSVERLKGLSYPALLRTALAEGIEVPGDASRTRLIALLSADAPKKQVTPPPLPSSPSGAEKAKRRWSKLSGAVKIMGIAKDARERSQTSVAAPFLKHKWTSNQVILLNSAVLLFLWSFGSMLDAECFLMLSSIRRLFSNKHSMNHPWST